MIKMMLIAGAGGFLGTCGRFLVNRWCAAFSHGPFPLATFIVNLVGCFLFGLFFGWLQRHGMLSSAQNALLVTGFCGGFTTFSTFASEIWTMSNRGDLVLSLVYLFASVALGVALVWLGRAITE